MKLRTIFLASALLATPAYAADLGVLTSLDVCDELGLTALTISSDTNCLQVSGTVYSEFYWGDYQNAIDLIGANPLAYGDYHIEIDDNGGGNDWYSYIETYLKFVGTAPSDIGPAKIVVDIYAWEETNVLDGVAAPDGEMAFDYAYVSVGDTTVLSAGLQDTIANLDDDETYGWLPTFMSDDSGGVAFDNNGWNTFEETSHAIQVVTDLGNGISVGGGIESLEFGAIGENRGNAVGVISYGGETLTAHLTLVAADMLDGELDKFAMHAGVSAIFDNIKARAALAANDTGWWNGLLSAEGTFDMFTLAATVDANSEREWGAVGSATMDITELVVLKGAVRYLDSDTAISDDEGLEVRLRAEYKATEALTLAVEGGHIWVGANAVNGSQQIFDGLIEAIWAPGGGFEATSALAANTLGAYEVSFTASKSFD